jgi:hypothetical protein
MVTSPHTKLLSSSLILLVVAVTVAATHSVPSVFAAGNDDSDNREIGVWWVNNYHDTDSNLSNTQLDAEGFYNILGTRGFTRRFDNGDDNAWESHFEKASVGGQDSNFVDDVDFVYFSGHGDPNAFYFGTNHDGDGSYTFQVHYSEADWGDRDLEWIFIPACEVLQSYPTRWNPAFHTPRALHGITGFHTNVWDSDQLGTRFAMYLTDLALSIKEAWRQATQRDPYQTPDNVAAIYAVWYHYYAHPTADKHYWNEHLPGIGSGMYSDPPPPKSGVVVVNIEYDNWTCGGW